MRGLSHSETQLTQALKDFQRAWNVTAQQWQDKARQDFNKDYIEEFVPATKASITATSQITQLLQQVVRDCS